MAQGQINQYRCAVCGKVVTTLDKDDGTTPAMVSCHTGQCLGIMYSSFYQVDQTLVPDYEWVKPTEKVPKHFRDYVKRGGLMLRKIEETHEEK